MKHSQTRFIPLPDWPDHHPWPPVAGLRHLVFEAQFGKNGFDKVFVRKGRTVLIDEKAFFAWLEEGRGAPPASSKTPPAKPR